MTTTRAGVPACLRTPAPLVQPALRAAVAGLDPATRAVASYHLGWTDAQGAPREGEGGKAIRPALALLGARAVGAAPEVAVPGAVAVELVHNFSLLHDDLVDGDERRRHRPTVWAQWGPAAAILTGDALQALAQQVLLAVPGPAGAAAARRTADAAQELIRGQVEDLAFEGRADIDLSEVLAMAAAKTGALLGASIAVGAVLAGGTSAQVHALDDFGRELGLAFQLVDDTLGIWGDPARTGKPVRADLRARKTSLPVAWTLGQGGTAAARLHDWLGTPGPDAEDDLLEIAEMIRAAGGQDWALAEAEHRFTGAQAALAGIAPPEAAAADLRALGTYVVARER